MENLQVFNFENQNVRALMINDEPFWVGKDVAIALGYAKPRNAIAAHVDEEDKKVAPIQGNIGGVQGMTIINESGLYSLILSSKLPSAKKFKRWVTSEVLPALRKTGGYKLPDNPMDILKLTFEALEQTNKNVQQHEDRIKKLEGDIIISTSDYNFISHTIKNKVNQVMSEMNMNLRDIRRSDIFNAINSDLNNFIGVKTRSQFKAKDFDKALEFIQNWQLSDTNKKEIEQEKLSFEWWDVI